MYIDQNTYIHIIMYKWESHRPHHSSDHLHFAHENLCYTYGLTIRNVANSKTVYPCKLDILQAQWFSFRVKTHHKFLSKMFAKYAFLCLIQSLDPNFFFTSDLDFGQVTMVKGQDTSSDHGQFLC